MLVDNDVLVVGVSGDSVYTQQLFKKVNGLNFTLLADIKGDVAKSFGVPLREGGEIKKKIDDKEEVFVRGVTARRWTFVIDTEGTIVHKNQNVDVGKDSDDIVEVVKRLKAKS